MESSMPNILVELSMWDLKELLNMLLASQIFTQGNSAQRGCKIFNSYHSSSKSLATYVKRATRKSRSAGVPDFWRGNAPAIVRCMIKMIWSSFYNIVDFEHIVFFFFFPFLLISFLSTRRHPRTHTEIWHSSFMLIIKNLLPFPLFQMSAIWTSLESLPKYHSCWNGSQGRLVEDLGPSKALFFH